MPIREMHNPGPCLTACLRAHAAASEVHWQLGGELSQPVSLGFPFSGVFLREFEGKARADNWLESEWLKS
jgi:hypothetical protein